MLFPLFLLLRRTRKPPKLQLEDKGRLPTGVNGRPDGDMRDNSDRVDGITVEAGQSKEIAEVEKKNRENRLKSETVPAIFPKVPENPAVFQLKNLKVRLRGADRIRTDA